MEECGEAEVAAWFMDAWGGENGTWVNGFLLPGCVLQDLHVYHREAFLEDYKNLAVRPEATASTMEIDEILRALSHYHVVALLDKPWSSIIKYSCSCPEFCKCGAC